jgi:hypothetical protein
MLSVYVRDRFFTKYDTLLGQCLPPQLRKSEFCTIKNNFIVGARTSERKVTKRLLYKSFHLAFELTAV